MTTSEISQVSDLLKHHQNIGRCTKVRIWMYLNLSLIYIYRLATLVFFFPKMRVVAAVMLPWWELRIRTDEFFLNQHIKQRSRSWRRLLWLWHIWIHAHECVCSWVLLQGRILLAIMTDVDHLQTQMWTCETVNLFRNKGWSFQDLNYLLGHQVLPSQTEK